MRSAMSKAPPEMRFATWVPGPALAPQWMSITVNRLIAMQSNSPQYSSSGNRDSEKAVHPLCVESENLILI